MSRKILEHGQVVKVQNWPVKDLDPGHGWIACMGVTTPCMALQLSLQGFSGPLSQKKRRESTHARNSPFKIPSKMRACADSRRFFVTTDLKIPVAVIVQIS